MAFVDWKPSLSVMVDEMDRQHKQLIDLINKPHEAMKSGKGKGQVGQSLDAVVKYALTHFKAEESFMQKVGYPELGDQKRTHALFTQKAADLQKRFKSGEELKANDIPNFLRNWLNDHIIKEDAKHGDHVARKAAVAAR